MISGVGLKFTGRTSVRGLYFARLAPCPPGDEPLAAYLERDCLRSKRRRCKNVPLPQGTMRPPVPPLPDREESRWAIIRQADFGIGLDSSLHGGTMSANVSSVCRPAPAPAAALRLWGIALAVAAAFFAPASLAQERSGAEVVKAQCARCHEAGTAGAPRIGDRDAWVPRMKMGVDLLVRSAIRGHGGMPPRGGRADLTDAEIRNAVLYMFNPSGPPKSAAAGAQPAKAAPRGAGPHRVTADGVDVYFGIMSAERMRSYPKGSPEAALHGGVPTGSGYYHVNVSLFEAADQSQIKGASVELEMEQVGMSRERRDLEPVTIGDAASYGAYVRMAPKRPYVFVVRARKPGSSQAIEARFQERAD
jgi:cytochrome c5